ncbi:MAG: hypothetical protein PHQ75_02430 [Thermoguttaceae bacterium]|nr:hypothetical protein [Thermoguttaceae bacterium]
MYPLKRCFSSETFAGVRLIMSNVYWIYIYPVFAVIYMLLVLSGLEISESGKAEFFGKSLPPMMGMSEAENLRFCFIGFVYHFWWIAMMMLAFGGLKAILSTWEPNFLNFVRFTRKDQFYLESLRWYCFGISMLVIVCPFIFAACVGCWQVGLTASEAWKLLCSTIPSLVLTGILIYIAGSCRLPDYYSGLFFTFPLVLTGIRMFMVNRGLIEGRHWFLPLIPYCYVDQENSLGAAMLTSLCALILLLSIRGWLSARTERLEQVEQREQCDRLDQSDQLERIERINEAC